MVSLFLWLCFTTYAYLCYDLVACAAFPIPSKAEIMYEFSTNIKLWCFSRPKSYTLSNGAHGFPVRLVIYAENAGWMQAQFEVTYEQFNAFCMYIIHIRITAKIITPLERAYRLGPSRNNVYISNLVFICMRFLLLKSMGILKGRVRAYLYKEAVRICILNVLICWVWHLFESSRNIYSGTHLWDRNCHVIPNPAVLVPGLFVICKYKDFWLRAQIISAVQKMENSNCSADLVYRVSVYKYWVIGKLSICELLKFYLNLFTFDWKKVLDICFEIYFSLFLLWI
jgi:hypothetical protein